jgi:hypothetical protein
MSRGITMVPGARLTIPQWEALRWLASPTSYANATDDSIYATMPKLVRNDSGGRWRSTPDGRKALDWAPIWAALDRAASNGRGFIPTRIARRLAREGVVTVLGGEYPTLELAVGLTDAGRALVHRGGLRP